MTKTQTKKKPPILIDTKYYLHIIEPDNLLSNYEFIELNDFLKKHKKNPSGDLFIGDLIEYYPAQDGYALLESIIQRLGQNKKIILQGVDARAVANNFIMDQISLNFYNALIYGAGKKTIHTMPSIKNILITFNKSIKIEKIQFLNSIHYYIECSKI